MNTKTGTINQKISETKLRLLDQWKSKQSDIYTIKSSPEEKTCFELSFAQKRLWFFEELFPNKAVYNMPCAFIIHEQININILNEAINRIIQRHSILKANFFLKDGIPYQKINNDAKLKIKVIDLKNEKKDQKKQKALALAAKLAAKPFSLANDLLMRASLFLLNDSQQLLFISMHHLIGDGWSLGILLNELITTYHSLLNNPNISAPKLRINYSDYVQWQNEIYSVGKLDNEINYWKKQLDCDFNLLELPFDKKRKKTPSFKGKRCQITIPEATYKKLNLLTHENQSTMFVLLMSAFKTLLYRYTNTNDLIIGTPVANRNTRDIEPLIGLFVNTLAIRSYISSAQTFNSVLQSEKSTIFDAYKHQNLPFEKLVQILKPNRNLNISPLFNVMFVFQNFNFLKSNFSGANLTPHEIHNGTSKFDILLSLASLKDEISGFIEYDCSLFNEDTIKRLIASFNMLLIQIADNPDKKISDYNILSATDINKITKKWNKPITQPAETKCVHEIFEEMVTKFPNEKAVSFENIDITYDMLNKKANQLAKFMISKGVGPENIIGILLDYKMEMIIAIIAILKLGSAYLPIDTTCPQHRLEFIINNAKIKTLLTDNHLLPKITGLSVNSICLDASSEQINSEDHQNINISVSPKNLAYVIYTSGTTGNPKGVLIPHNNIINLFECNKADFNFNQKDIIPLFHSYAFDFSVWEIFSALLHGGQLIIIPPTIRKSPLDFHSLLIKKNITVLNQTPSAFNTLIQIEKNASKPLKNLRLIVFGGETLNFGSLKTWFEIHKENAPQLINMYGITEVTVHTSIYKIKKSDVVNSINSIVGCPLNNTNIFILDQNLEISPIGVINEIYVGGNGLARGYLNNNELTNERFIIHPALNIRLYKSGDYGRYNNDGKVEFIGRKDSQIKIRGFRVELAEIETAINKHPMVSHSCIALKTISKENKSLAAYIVASNSKIIKNNIEDLQLIEEKQVTNWNMVFNDYYSINASNKNPPSFNTTGWISSYTNKPIPSHHMTEWVNTITNRILSYKPTRVFEIGFGTGMLISKIAPTCQIYDAIDNSQQAVDFVAQNLVSNKKYNLSHVNLCQASGLDFELNNSQDYDCIIINSVIQYFPSLEYLTKIIEKIIPHIKNGIIVLGDIRSYPLMIEFYISLLLKKKIKTESIPELKKFVSEYQEKEKELFIHPEFFYYLQNEFSKISAVNIFHKTGTYKNEMNLFRYDVVLKIGQNESFLIDNTISWNANSKVDDIFKILDKNKYDTVILTQIPNKRTYNYHLLAEKIKLPEAEASKNEFKCFYETKNPIALYEPNDFKILEQKTAYITNPIYYKLDSPGYFDILLSRKDTHSDRFYAITPTFSKNNFSNTPLKNKTDRYIIDSIKTFLQNILPDYMLPAHYFIIDDIPRTNNGKIAYDRLPDIHEKRSIVSTKFEPPHSETEKAVLNIFSNILNIQKIGVHDSFFELGGHSLLAVQLIFSLRKKLGINIPLQLIMKSATIKSLANYIDKCSSSNDSSNILLENHKPNLLNEFKIESKKIKPTVQLPPYSKIQPAKNILLTGASGFIGAFLLHELLNTSDVKIYCLVKASNTRLAKEKIINNMLCYKLWDDSMLEKLAILTGDLSLKKLGLPEQEYRMLADNIDEIYHNGAIVNFVYPYESLKKANVEGTREIIRLASSKKIKSIHYISSLYVFTKDDYLAEGKITEEKVPHHCRTLNSGYLQSKWVSEKLIIEARKFNIPSTIFRLGRVAGASNTYITQQNDFLWKLVRIGINSRSLPMIKMLIDIVPADYVSKAIIGLAKNPNSINKNFHLFNPSPLPYPDLIKCLKKLGYSIKLMPSKKWLDNLLDLNNQSLLDDQDRSMLPILSNQYSSFEPPYFCCKDTVDKLSKINITCPPITPELIQKYILYFKEQNYFKRQK